LNLKELSTKYPQIIKAWKKGLDLKFPKGESLTNVSIRLNKFINNQLIKKNIRNINSLIFTHNVILRCLIGDIYKIKKKEWFKININYFDLLEFRIENNKLVSNIERVKYLSIFKNFYKNYNNV
jgi:broad specificity phosphatase PhoE